MPRSLSLHLALVFALMAGPASAQSGRPGAAEAARTVGILCAECHVHGERGAPRIGHVQDWAARLGRGRDALVARAIVGFGTMPPRGGAADLDDLAVARAVVLMANQSGARFAWPAPR